MHPQEWQLDTEGISEAEINLRILKAIDRHTAKSSGLQHQQHGAPAADDRHHQQAKTDVPTIKIADESDFPDLGEAIKIKKSKKEKKKPPTPPSSSSSSTSSSTSSPSPRPDPTPQATTYTPAVRVKEADSIKLSPLPEPPFWEGWRQQLYDDVGAASGVGHDIFQWLHVIQMPGTTFESLADSRGRPTLDVKLGSALRKLLKGDLKQQVQTKAKALERQGRMLRGRQILWLISQQYALDENRGALYNMGDLMNLPYAGDGKLEAFLTLWENQVEGQQEPQPERNLEILLYEKIKRSELLSTQLRNYERLPQSHPDRSYSYLMQVIQTAVNLQRK